MMLKIGYAFVLVVVLTGCNAKKHATYEFPAGTHSKTSGLYPLPPDSGQFITIPITSVEAYVETFAPIAQLEMQAYGIPASIKLAQGILESGAGRGVLTQKTNNHFGIKCHVGWGGDFDFHDDDARGECFRKYNHPLYSFRDHSIFLSSRDRYNFLFEYQKNDYKKWAHGLQKAGYATDRSYPEKLISLIKRYNLDRYDKEVLRGKPGVKYNPKAFESSAYVVKKGDTLYAISKQYAIPVEELIQINRLNGTHLSIGQVLTLQRAAAAE